MSMETVPAVRSGSKPGSVEPEEKNEAVRLELVKNSANRVKGEFEMMNDKSIRMMLIVIASLLFLNLFYHPILSVIAPEAVAESLGQDLNFGSRTGSGITCSNDGKYVYATDGSSVYRSIDFGKRGTWEEVAR